MAESNQVLWPRRLTHWAAVLIGVAAGWSYFWHSLRIFGGEPGPATWLGFITVVARFLAQFLLLLVSLVGAFRPRVAAYWIAASFSLAAVLTLMHIILAQYVSISGLAAFSLYWIVVPWAIAGLFFYSCAADASTNHGRGCD